MHIIRRALLLAALICASGTASPQSRRAEQPYQDRFDLAACVLRAEGRNPYFVLEPGFRLTLEGGGDRLEITVLDDTRVVDGITTRVVEEREWKRGTLYEVSRNYFALCPATGDVYYFGEAVDFYQDGRVVRHDGSWLAGEGGNRAGLMMPGRPAAGMRYYQEVAPKAAMDRAEIRQTDAVCETPAGRFRDCLVIRETTPLEPSVTEDKYHAPGIGLVRDGDLRLTGYGPVPARAPRSP